MPSAAAAVAPRQLFLTSLDEASIFGLRSNLTLHESRDGGATWAAVKVIDARDSGYSALTILPNGSLACLYERSNVTQIIFLPDHISFEVIWSPV